MFIRRKFHDIRNKDIILYYFFSFIKQKFKTKFIYDSIKNTGYVLVFGMSYGFLKQASIIPIGSVKHKIGKSVVTRVQQ
jgi:hypothetical protein